MTWIVNSFATEYEISLKLKYITLSTLVNIFNYKI